jgi:hypothetical protein
MRSLNSPVLRQGVFKRNVKFALVVRFPQRLRHAWECMDLSIAANRCDAGRLGLDVRLGREGNGVKWAVDTI